MCRGRFETRPYTFSINPLIYHPSPNSTDAKFCVSTKTGVICRGGFVMSRWIYNPPRMDISICNA